MIVRSYYMLITKRFIKSYYRRQNFVINSCNMMLKIINFLVKRNITSTYFNIFNIHYTKFENFISY